MVSPLDAKAKAAQDMIADIETAAEGNAELYTRWCMERFGRPDSRGMWKDRAEKAEATITAQAERIAELEQENAELKTRDDPAFTYPFVLRARAAEAEVRTLREALTAGVRAANLALFVIRKQGVMPNSSWQAGFEKDMAIASAALRAKEP